MDMITTEAQCIKCHVKQVRMKVGGALLVCSSCKIGGTEVPISIGELVSDVYLDIVNLDRYDVVLGTPFMRRHNIVLDFGNSSVVVDGKAIPTLGPKGEETTVQKRKVKAPTAPPGTRATAARSRADSTVGPAGMPNADAVASGSPVN